MTLQPLGHLVLVLLTITLVVPLCEGQTFLLAERTFIEQLKADHPRFQEGRLQLDFADAGVFALRGMFDPVLQGGWHRKHFSNRLYYNRTGLYLDQPLPALGMTLHGGMDVNSGLNLNPERSTPVNGQLAAGVTLPLLRGMVIDHRRTERRLGDIYRQEQDFEWINFQNDLLLQSLNAYWRWAASRQRLELFEEVLSNNLLVFQGIKLSFLQGDLPAIDTVEAFLQYRRIRIQYESEQILYNQTLNQLLDHVWQPELRAQLMQADARADEWPDPGVRMAMFAPADDATYLQDHPDLRTLEMENQRLDALQRWQREQMKPEINLHYNFLQNLNMTPQEQAWLSDNYVAGVSFQMPLLIRQARGRSQQLRVRQEQNRLAYTDEKNAIRNEVRAADFALRNLREQVQLFEALAADALTMYRAELRKFELGESSVFLVNAREIQYLQAMLGYIDLRREYLLQGYRTWHAQGILYRMAGQ
jgi:outer membrane protein TolC